MSARVFWSDFVLTMLGMCLLVSVRAQHITRAEVTVGEEVIVLDIAHFPPGAGGISNEAPAVTVSAPAEGARLGASNGVVLAADAYDSDGTIVRVEFFAGDVAIGEDTTSPYRVVWTAPGIGAHVITARATDDQGAVAVSEVVNVTTVPSLPVTANFTFEGDDGFSAGPLGGQGSWAATPGVQVTNEDAHSGTQSIVLDPEEVNAIATIVLEQPGPEQGVRYFDFWIKPATGTGNASARFLFPTSATIRFARDGNTASPEGYFFAEGSEEFWRTNRSFAVNADGIADAWHRITVRRDLAYGGMDVYLDGKLAFADVFTEPGSNQFKLEGHPSEPTWFDGFRVTEEHPLFADADEDGMDDAWEISHGLDPARRDRTHDPDRDSLTNIQEFAHDTNPNNADTDGDGLEDGWEALHDYDALAPQSTELLVADTDGDGLTFLEEAKAGTDASSPDTDGDGVSDDVELEAGWDPREWDLDIDGDGVSNAEEMANGADPVDYYNGHPPVITSLGDPAAALLGGSYLEVQVTDASGNILVNAPVTFHAGTDDHGFARDVEGKRANARRFLRVRTNAEGVARVYVVRADELLEPMP